MEIDSTQAKKNMAQAGGIFAAVGYVYAVNEFASGLPLWAIFALLFLGVIVIGAVFYAINRLTVQQVRDMATKIDIIMGAISRLDNIVDTLITDTNPQNPTATKYPAYTGVEYTTDNTGDYAIIDKAVWWAVYGEKYVITEYQGDHPPLLRIYVKGEGWDMINMFEPATGKIWCLSGKPPSQEQQPK